MAQLGAARTFEAGTLTGTDAFDAMTGTELSVTTSAPLKGTRSVLSTWVAGSSYGTFNATTFTASGKATLYGYLYLNVSALPSAEQRLVLGLNGTTNLLQIAIMSTGALQLYSGATVVGTSATGTLATGTTYRVGWRYTAGTGTNGVVELYLATGDAAFGAALLSTSAGAMTLAVTDLRVGMTTAIALAGKLDQIALDDATMPAPSGAARRRRVLVLGFRRLLLAGGR